MGRFKLTIGGMIVVLFAPFIAQAAEGRVTVEAPMFEGGEGLTFFTYGAREFEKQRPDVAVNLYGDPRIVDKLRIRILEGTYPEVTNAFLNYNALIRSGLILPIDRYLDGPSREGDSTWRESFLPGSLDAYTGCSTSVHHDRRA